MYNIANMDSKVWSYAGFVSDRNIATCYKSFDEAVEALSDTNYYGFVVPEVGTVWRDSAGIEYVVTSVSRGDVFLDNNRMVTVEKFFKYFHIGD